MLSYYVSLRSEFHVVMSVTNSAYELCSVRLYFRFFVEGVMSCLRCLCLFAYNGVVCFVCLRPVSCVLSVVSFSALSILHWPFGVL